MRRRQPLPRLWMMTDARQGEGLFAALARLPRGAGVAFRHYDLPTDERRALFRTVERIARKRGLMLVAANAEDLRAAWRLDGLHNHAARRDVHAAAKAIKTASVHNMHELRRAERNGADIVFVSPVFATRSHPGARFLGPLRLGFLARQARVPVVALGGMNAVRGRRLRGLGAYGWAAIDAWMGEPQ